MKHNLCFYKDGEEVWISRSVAVVCFTLAPVNGKWCVLANQRGVGTPDFQGCWNVPCGYLDYNETAKQAAIRETYEETGVQLSDVLFWGFEDDPEENRQNVTLRYFTIIDNPQPGFVSLSTEALSGEEQEVSSVAWIPLDVIADFDWAFDHDILIVELQEILDLV